MKPTTNTQWTPGPWYAASTGNHQGLIISEHDGSNVAVSYDAKDARLIALAPEMLDGLEMTLRAIANPKDIDPLVMFAVTEKLTALIARAKGEN